LTAGVVDLVLPRVEAGFVVAVTVGELLVLLAFAFVPWEVSVVAAVVVDSVDCSPELVA
jgi:hypothetical protein